MRYLRTIRDRTQQMAPAIDALRARLQDLESHFRRAIQASGSDPPSDCLSGEGADRADAFHAPSASLARQFDDKLRAGGKVPLASLTSSDPDPGWKRFSDSIRHEALAFLVEHGLAPTGESSSQGIAPDEESRLAGEVAPPMSNVGGGRRVLAVIPRHTPSTDWQQTLADHFGDCVNSLPTDGGDSFVCCEVQGIAIENVIDRLAQEHAAVLDMAARLHTRIDVEWRGHR